MNKKQNRGITLVALVITIIVLIILAGVSINAVMNGGLIQNAKDAKNEYQEAKAEEEKALSQLEIGKLEMEFLSKGVPYKAKYGYISGVTLGETVSEFEKRLPEGYEIELDPEIDTEEDPIVRTGMVVKKEGEPVAETVVYGDLDGYNTIDSTDVAYMLTDIEGGNAVTWSDIEKVASDVNHDNVLNWQDWAYVDYDESFVLWLLIDKDTWEDFKANCVINQNLEPLNPRHIIIEKFEESRKKWVNSLTDTEKAKFTWQEEVKKYTYLADSNNITVGDILENMPGAVIATGTTADTILAEGETIVEGYKIMLAPDFKSKVSTENLNLVELLEIAEIKINS